MKKLVLDLSMVGDETLRAIEETLLIELHALHTAGNDEARDRLAIEIRKLTDHLDS